MTETPSLRKCILFVFRFLVLPIFHQLTWRRPIIYDLYLWRASVHTVCGRSKSAIEKKQTELKVTLFPSTGDSSWYTNYDSFLDFNLSPLFIVKQWLIWPFHLNETMWKVKRGNVWQVELLTTSWHLKPNMETQPDWVFFFSHAHKVRDHWL